ncbi:GMC family oxidoreductase N-terminal domain-containing protein [Candidatus Pelagibacter sp.]|nr:GMC family oxidoreductase N-terminal domain-containing protein [Candidatus Pelagibacter sp.]
MIKNLNFFNNKEDIDIENIIIGSGAGGSTTAYELLKQQKKCIILEEGPNVNNLDLSNIGRNIVKLYKNNGATPLISNNGGPMIGYGQGSCVGGSTYVNAGYFSNTPEWIFNNWVKNNKTILEFSHYKKLIEEIKSEIEVNIEQLTSLDNDSKILYEKSKKQNWKIEKCERYSSGIVGKEKQNMNTTYLKKISENGIDIFHDAKVLKIFSEKKEAKSLIVKNNLNSKTYKFNFKNLFICCGPINTPFLLQNNNLIKNSHNNFEFHINFKVIVKFKKPINFNNSSKYNPDLPISIYFMREFEKEGVLLSAANSELPYILATASHFSEEIKKDIIQNHDHYAMYIYQIKSNSLGNIKSFFNNPYVSYSFDNRDLLEVKRAIERTSKLFFEADVDSILYPIENSGIVKNQKEALILSENFKKKKLHLVSVHGMSSMKYLPNSDCATNYYGKLNNYKNIFINDASIIPGNTGESPQATIMAFAKFITKNIST